MAETIARANGWLSGVVWGPAGLLLLALTGAWLTMRTGFFQFVRLRHWLGCTLGAIFTDRAITAHTGRDEGAISQFQSMCTALAATIGTGNIVGVATAILSGGPGAVFWMWVMALLGTMTAYAEELLGIYYRRRDAKGQWIGGPMYYLAEGLGAKPGCRALGRGLAALFALFCVLASFGIGNMSQANAIAGNLEAAFGFSPALTGGVLAAGSALVILRGLRQVAAITEKLVPAMALVYLMGAGLVVLTHFWAVSEALAAIFRGALGLRAAGGGAVGYGVWAALRWGAMRGAFSNEAGLGSSVMAGASSNVTEPARQGMWGIFEVCADTLVVCTLTALTILCSGVVDLETGLPLNGVGPEALTGAAFSTTFGSLGPAFIALSVLLFAYSTILGWSHYGATAFGYLFGPRAVTAYKLLFSTLIFVGAVTELGLVWALADTFNGLMMVPNLIGVLALSGTVARVTRNYLDRTLRGEHIPPLRSATDET